MTQALPSPARPRLWTIATAYVLAMVLQVLIGIVILVVALGPRPSVAPDAAERAMLSFPALLASMAVAAAAIGAAAGLGAWLSPAPWRQRLRLLPWRGGLRVVALLSVAVVTLSAAEGWLLEAVHPARDWSWALAERAIRAMTPAQKAAMAAQIVVLSPAAEELFFRGYLQTRLRERWGPWASIAVTAVLFGVFHMDPTHALVAAGIGLLLGWACEKTGSILPCIAMHMVNNAVALGGALLIGDIDGSAGLRLALAAAAVAAFAASVLAVRRALRA